MAYSKRFYNPARCLGYSHEHLPLKAVWVFIEVLLNAVGALTWDYSWWSASAPWLIFLVGYLPFSFLAFCVYDMDSVKNKLSLSVPSWAST